MNGGPIAGATAPTLVINPTVMADAGVYDVVVENGCATVTSLPALLTVGCPTDLVLADQASLGERTVHSVAWDSTSGRFLAFGGRDGAGTFLNTTQTWTGSEWQTVPTNAGLTARSDQAMCEAPGGGVVLFGGKTPSNAVFGGTWLFRNGEWTLLSITGPGPASRGGHAMAFDRARNEAVLFGGFIDAVNLNLSREIWALRFNGSSWQWQLLDSGSGPSARFALGMTYDEALQRIVIFGGYDGGTPTLPDDTWAWNGTVWSPVASVVTPPRRYYHTMQWDASRQTALLVGGWGYNSAFFHDQWDLGVAGWSRRATDFMGGPILLHAAATSPAGDMLLCGGAPAPAATPYASTWVGSNGPVIHVQPQPLSVFAGEQAVFSITASGTEPLSYQWRKDGINLVDGGRLAGVRTDTLTINYTTYADAGLYDAVVTGPCSSMASNAAALTVLCYANCDGSTTAPVLNIADFTCFLNRFAAGDPWANCNHSTTPPVLNVADFTCFLNAFAAGCP